MQSFVRYQTVAMCLLLAVGSVLHAADKPPSDPRLAQPVTIECVNTRLHTVVEQLSEKTGVTIRCGKNKDDWRVRDIPIVVCAKEIPVGKLLKAVTNATHTFMSSYVSNGTTTYRIWRDKKRAKAISDYEEARNAAGIAAGKFDWDVWTQLKDMQGLESDDKPLAFSNSLRDPAVKAISSIMSELGPEARDKVLGGETIRLNLNNAPETMRDRLQTAFDGVLQGFAELSGLGSGTQPEPPTEDEAERSQIEINFGNRIVAPDLISVQVMAGGYEKSYDVQRMADRLRSKGSDIPPRPKIPTPPGTEEMDAHYARLITQGGESILPAKVTLEALKDVKEPTYGHVLAALSKATGVAVVAEDFQSQKSCEFSNDNLGGIFGRELAMSEVFDRSQWEFYDTWHVNKEDKIVLGCARDWVLRHNNLVPEKLINNLKAKLNSSGLELDDLEPLTTLTEPQYTEWIEICSGFESLQGNVSQLAGGSLWPIYYSLSSSDRSRAQAGESFSLAEFDPTWLVSVFQGRNKWMKGLMPAVGAAASEERLAESKKRAEALTNAELFPCLSMRIRQKDYGRTGKHIWFLDVDGEKDGEKYHQEDHLGPFPIYSPSREAELQKKPEVKK